MSETKEIPIEGINYLQMKIEKKPASPEYKPRDSSLIPSANRTVVINPDRICMPLGAMWAVLGINRAIPFVQGAQGCTTYVRYTFCRIFKEPASIATASFHEDAAVFGGRRNVVEGIRNLVVRYWPDAVGVVTTCSSEIIGDDMTNFLKLARQKLAEEIGPEKAETIPVVLINTPSFAGSHLDGYDRASKAFLESLATTKDKPNGKVNIIPGMIYPGDIREIKYILKEMGIGYTMLFDISDTLDAPLKPPQTLPYYPPGGTTIKEIKDMGNAKATFALQPEAGGEGARFLHKKYGMEAVIGPLPVGVAATDAFVKALSRITGKKAPQSVLDDRGRLVDAMADTFHNTMMKRVAIFGDPGIVLGLTRFACELGMTPVAISGGTATKTFTTDAESIFSEYRHLFMDAPKVFNGGDLFELEEYLKECKNLDLILGHSKGVDISKELEVPLVRVGFPIYDRFGYQKKAIVGYRGGERLLYEMANEILDYQYPDDRTQQV
jgi:nitrogenase molybdenum-iron protein beta chain